MGTINITQYDQTPGLMGDANQINSALSTIQTVINGNLEDVNIKTAAAIAIAKLAGYPADGTKALMGDGTWGNRLISSAQSTTNISVTSTNAASPTTILTLSAATYLATPTILWLLSIGGGTYNGGCTSLTYELWDGATRGPSASYSTFVITPTAGSHTYSLRGYVDTGSATLICGDGANTHYVPGIFIAQSI